MKTAIAIGLCAAMALAAPSVAQSSAPGGAAVPVDSTVKKFAGVWEGTFASDHMPGGMRLELKYDSAWKASINIVAQETMSSDGTSVRVEGNRVSWNQELMGMACESVATLSGALLKGAVNCDHGGITFELKRRE